MIPADDLYCGGDTQEDALYNWIRVLQAMKRNDLCLNAPKTVVCPTSTTILGWIWSLGTFKESPHKLSALQAVELPATVQGLQSFVGAYKVLSRVLPSHAEYLTPLDQGTAGKQSRNKFVWSDGLVLAFHNAQSALDGHKAIAIPRSEDCLWIVMDGSVKKRGVAAKMYAL